MQFNPACLSASPSTGNVTISAGQSTEFLTNNIPNFSDSTVTQQQQQNGWPNVISAMPFYGIYNNGFVAVPNTQDAAPPAIPVASSSTTTSDANKKKVAKRPCDPLPDKSDDKTQSLDEEQKMKRQRRLLKNREAAQQFRQRQKEYIQNLERKVTELNTHVGETHKHIELLTTENRLLRDQLVYLYNVMRQNLSLSPTSPAPTSSPSAFSITSSPAPPAPPTSVAADLGLLGFKGFGGLESLSGGYEEMLKNAHTSSPTLLQMLGQSAAMTPQPSPAPSPGMTPMTSPGTPRIPDLGTLSIAKGMEMEACEGMTNPMLMSRFGSLIGKSDHEAQTVPELGIKAEGSGNM